MTFQKPCNNTNFLENLCPISPLSTAGKLLEEVILRIFQRHIEEKGLLNASQFGFRVRHSTTLQCMSLTGHVSLNFNSNMATAAVFLDTEKAFDTTWHLGLLHKLYTLQFSTNLVKLIGCFLFQRKLGVSVEGGISAPRNIQAEVTQVPLLSPTLYSLYINDTPQTSGVYLGLFADDTCIFICDRTQGGLCSQKAAARAQCY
jgi:hypothetical protein